MEGINVAVITGNLTRDPEVRHTGGGLAICELRVAVNGRRKDGQSGEWVDKANYFDVTVFGARGEACGKHLGKGGPVAVEGRLDWREWEAKDGSGKRQAVQIIANVVRFLGKAPESTESAETQERPSDQEQPAGVGADDGGGGEDDIPF
jgi:single-strand DNA-binding protein